MTLRVEFDPNVRTLHNGTFVGFEDIHGHIEIGEEVVLFESEGGIQVHAFVKAIDYNYNLVFFDVAWDTLNRISNGNNSESISKKTGN